MYLIRTLLMLVVLGSALLWTGCSSGETEPTLTNVHGIDLANFDTTCQPCDDFYQYSNGAWLANNPIPPEYGSWSTPHEVYIRNSELLQEILEDAAGQSSADKGTVMQQIGDFYSSAMDTNRIQQDGATPLQADLDRIAAIENIEDLKDAITYFHGEGIEVLFDVIADQDLIDNTKVIFFAEQGGLGLPDRDYYTREDSGSVAIREQYVEHIANMFGLLGEDEESALVHAGQVMNIETRLANASLTNVQMREPEAWYNQVTVKEAENQTPNFKWSSYFSSIGLLEIEDFSLTHPVFFAEVNTALAEIPIEDWKAYLRWNIVSISAPYLSEEFVNEDFRFFSTVLRGTEELQPRWRRVLRVIDRFLGEPLGQLFVKRAFPPSSKARAVEMVNNLLAAFKDRLDKADWMSDKTKERAHAKLASFGMKIGYPDKWRDYSALEIDRGTYNGNVRLARAFEMRRNLNKIGKPVDRAEWGMNPQTINAYYDPQKNEIVFPAGILQPPCFDGEIDDAINYGAMGAVIGHEITHGFDDQGRRFDEQGNLSDWWSEEDSVRFMERSQMLVDQFNAYVAVDDLHINGQLTLGENIADLGGTTVAYYALQKALEGKPRELIDGFTPEQRFFLSISQLWRTNQRPEGLRVQVNTDPHSPAYFRVLGPLSNMEEFKQAFGCDEGDKMIRSAEERVAIW